MARITPSALTRDAARVSAGYRIVRLQASLVVSDIERALSAIRAALA